MYCVTLTTVDPERLLAALRRNRVQFKVGAIREEGQRPPGSTAEDAQRIYDLVAGGLTYAAAAARSQVSYHTVLRIIQKPAKYGVKGPPIRRS